MCSLKVVCIIFVTYCDIIDQWLGPDLPLSFELSCKNPQNTIIFFNCEKYQRPLLSKTFQLEYKIHEEKN